MKVFLPASVMGSLGTSQRKKERKKGKTEKNKKDVAKDPGIILYQNTCC